MKPFLTIGLLATAACGVAQVGTEQPTSTGTGGTTTGTTTGTTSGTTTSGGSSGITCSPSLVAFGNVAVGTSATQSLTCTAQGATGNDLIFDTTGLLPQFELTINEVPVTGAKTFLFSSGQSTLDATISFTPSAATSVTSSFSYTACFNSSTCDAPVAISLTATGVGPSGLTITPDPIYIINGFTKQTVTVQNTGTASANLTCVYLGSTGDSSCDTGDAIFGFGTFSPGSPSPASPVQLAPQASLTFVVTYTSSGASSDQDILSVDYVPAGATAANTATAPISGSPPSPPLTCIVQVQPDYLDFGTVTIGTEEMLAATLTNAGTASCSVTNIQLSSGTDPSFAIDPSTPATLNIEAGASAQITVDFNLNNSNTPDQRSGEVTFSSNDSVTPEWTIPLTAETTTLVDGGMCPSLSTVLACNSEPLSCACVDGSTQLSGCGTYFTNCAEACCGHGGDGFDAG